MSLMEITEGGRRHDQNTVPQVLADSSVNALLTPILPVIKPVLLANVNLDSEDHLYVGCHLSTYLLSRIYLGSVDASNDKRGSRSQQLEIHCVENVGLDGKPHIYNKRHYSVTLENVVEIRN